MVSRSKELIQSNMSVCTLTILQNPDIDNMWYSHDGENICLDISFTRFY